MKGKIRVLLFFPLVIAVGVGTTVGLLFAQFEGLPNVYELERYRPSTTTHIYDSQNRLLGEFYMERRILVPLHRIPQHLIQATLAIEDNNFYDHIGIDLRGLARAFYRNMRAGRVVQGGSTITQQLAKILFLTPERSFSRKVKEALLALRIERTYSKEEILALYFNQIYLGSGAYGVEAAARTYFGKGVENLNLEEAALLAALPKAPSYLSPVRYPERARSRRNLVLGKMQEMGFIPPERAQEAQKAPLNIVRLKPVESQAPHFVEHVRRELQERFGQRELYQKGLRVYTTLDLDLQRAAREALVKGLKAVDRRRGLGQPPEEYPPGSPPPALRPGSRVVGRVTRVVGDRVSGIFGGHTASLTVSEVGLRENLSAGSPLVVEVVSVNAARGELTLKPVFPAEGALIALDVKTGAIRAMVGGRDFEKSQFNRATQALRQPGSSFKPFIYAAALEGGMRPNDMLVDAPVSYWDPSAKKAWRPTNYERRFFGRVTLQRALEHSINVATIRLLEKVGPRRVRDLAKRLGIESPVEPYLSMALGTSVVTLQELTSAYATIANGGLRTSPYTIERVEAEDGSTLYERELQIARVLDPETAYLSTHMLQGVIKRGTGRKAKVLKARLAGKTGTTDEFKDAWFIGFSPDLALGAWVGVDTNEQLGKRETGARAALPIWIDTMAAWLEEHPAGEFPVPRDIQLVDVDSRTGLLASASCRRYAIRVALRKGTEPSRTCDEQEP
ncbi:MAG: penicillin-binding protein 1A [Nitrospinota bacterium]